MNNAIIRYQLYMDQAGKCHYCNTKMVLNPRDQNDPRGCTIDHKVPKSLGGSNHRENLIGCCRKCNGFRGNMLYEGFVWFVDVYGTDIKPEYIFRNLDRTKPEYLDNLKNWALVFGKDPSAIDREGYLPDISKVAVTIPLVDNYRTGGRRAYLASARKLVEDIVSEFPYYEKNRIWIDHLKKEKAGG